MSDLYRLDRRRHTGSGSHTTYSIDYFEGDDAMARLQAAILAAEVDIWSELRREDLTRRTDHEDQAARTTRARALTVALGLRRLFSAKSGADVDPLSETVVRAYVAEVRQGDEWVKLGVQFTEPAITVTLATGEGES